ncbi:hypothetical protein MMC30_000333 [Trapelia coarctata]|nr:hypothetical protein [Trapelia coarctata]
MATTMNPASPTPRSSPTQKNQLPPSPCRRCGTSFATKKLLLNHVKTKPRCTKDKAYIQRCRQAKEMEYTQESHQQLLLKEPQLLQGFGGASIPLSSANPAISSSSANRLPRSRSESRPQSRSDSPSSSSTSTSSSGGIPINSARSTSRDGYRELHHEEHQDQHQEELYGHEYGDQDHHDEHDNTSESDFSDSYSFDSDSDY